jgi:hypothetical protein
MRIEWEEITGSAGGPEMMQRARVFGGWLVFAYDAILEASGLTFLPDPDHKWNGNSN